MSEVSGDRSRETSDNPGVARCALVSERYACADGGQREEGIEAAQTAIRAGELVVLPTDTVYGVGADVFDSDAIASLLATKGRGRDKPPPVLVGSVEALDGVASDIPDIGRALIDRFWPGGLTLVCHEQSSLAWDLGDNHGAVAVRMPDNEVARELLTATGPLAVSSANRTGHPPATTVEEAEHQLGEQIAVYLDGGSTPGAVSSTILDLTAATPRILRRGAIGLDALREIVTDLPDPDSTGPEED